MGEYIAVSENVMKRWEKELTEYGILYIFAMTGFGKTVQTQKFAESYYKIYHRFQASDEDFLIHVENYLEEYELSHEWEERDPRILGAKVRLAAYSMQPEQSREYLAQLKELAEQEKKVS